MSKGAAVEKKGQGGQCSAEARTKRAAKEAEKEKPKTVGNLSAKTLASSAAAAEVNPRTATRSKGPAPPASLSLHSAAARRAGTRREKKRGKKRGKRRSTGHGDTTPGSVQRSAPSTASRTGAPSAVRWRAEGGKKKKSGREKGKRRRRKKKKHAFSFPLPSPPLSLSLSLPPSSLARHSLLAQPFLQPLSRHAQRTGERARASAAIGETRFREFFPLQFLWLFCRRMLSLSLRILRSGVSVCPLPHRRCEKPLPPHLSPLPLPLGFFALLTLSLSCLSFFFFLPLSSRSQCSLSVLPLCRLREKRRGAAGAGEKSGNGSRPQGQWSDACKRFARSRR